MVKRYSYLDHLEEFRVTLISIIVFLLVSFIISMFYIDKIIILLQEPIKNIGIKLNYFRPEEKFLTYIKVGFTSSIFLSIPFAIIRLGYFVYPALKKNEKKYFYFFIIILPIIFYTGVFFSYKIIFPFALQFFYSFGKENIFIPMWGISNYFDLLIMLCVGTGIVFLLPLPLIFLIKTDIISIKVINKIRPYIIIFILIIAAIFSPPDVISQILIGVPLYLLFEISVLIGKLIKGGE